MMVDDSRAIASRLMPSLEELSNVDKVLCGYSYEDGKKIISEADIDIAVLDVNLPGKSGIDLLKYIKQDERLLNTTVIMMTDEASESREKLCMSAGADYFIDKFEDFENIINIVANARHN